MLKYAADENFSGAMVRGLERLAPELDIVRVQDGEMYRADDPEMLAWVAGEGRILLTHDIKTVPGHAYDRVRAGKPMPGVFAIPQDAPVGRNIEDLRMAALASEPGEWEGRVEWFPL